MSFYFVRLFCSLCDCILLQNDPPEDVPQLIDVPEFPNVDTLAPGDYIDCQRKNGTWEMVPIESFSDYRTEFQVIWPDGKLSLIVKCLTRLFTFFFFLSHDF